MAMVVDELIPMCRERGLGRAPWPVGIMTLKSRTLRPVAQLFVDRVREVVKPLAKRAL